MAALPGGRLDNPQLTSSGAHPGSKVTLGATVEMTSPSLALTSVACDVVCITSPAHPVGLSAANPINNDRFFYVLCQAVPEVGGVRGRTQEAAHGKPTFLLIVTATACYSTFSERGGYRGVELVAAALDATSQLIPPSDGDTRPYQLGHTATPSWGTRMG